LTRLTIPEPADFIYGSEAERLTAAGLARPLAGGPIAFRSVRLHRRGEMPALIPLEKLGPDIDLTALEQPRPLITTLPRRDQPGDRLCPLLMGIVNVTPDSFSDGGRFLAAEAAITHGQSLAAEGADLLDVGGESTRPGAAPVAEEIEAQRVLPVIAALKDVAPVSVDTRKGSLMRQAAAAGAKMLNDVSALGFDPEAARAAAKTGLPLVLMHAQGDPRTMQENPRYDNVLIEVYEALAERMAAAMAAGIAREKLIVDPGIGFGKTLDHNLTLFRHIAAFHALGVPVLLGASRKRWIAGVSKGEPADARLGGSLTAAVWAAGRGIQILRVHDVAPTAQALAAWGAIRA